MRRLTELYLTAALLILPGFALAQTTGNRIEAVAAAQEPESKPTVAVYVNGNVPDHQKEFIGKYLFTALINGGADVNDETAVAFLAAVGSEKSKRQTTHLDDSLICELGRNVGIRYICAVSIMATPSNAVTFSGRVISAKTGRSRFNGEAAGSLKTTEDLEHLCGILVEKMFDGKRIFGGPAAPEGAAQTAHIAANTAAAVVTDTAAAVAAGDSAETIFHPNTAVTPFENAEVVAIDRDTETDSDDTVTFKPPSMRVKNVAVVETEIDAQSGASTELTPADARLVTAELRREAVKNLPRGRYNVMTSETVYSQGSAVLDKCADENCVIILGSAIGADFIVRGTISKVLTRFTLSVEIYETEDGNLVASSDPIRSENLGDLLEQAAAVCADMYKTFVAATTPPPEPVAPPPPQVVVQEPDTPLWKLHKMGIDISVGAGGLIAGGYGGGIEWESGERITMPYSAGGAYLFLDAVYAELFLGYYAGDGKWESPNIEDQQDLPTMPRSCINIGVFAKYPFDIATGRVKLFPLLGLDYEAAINGKIKYFNGMGEHKLDGTNNLPDANTLSSLWFKIGGGLDFAMGKSVYLRAEAIYGLRAANSFERYCADKRPDEDIRTGFGQGVAVKVGVGVKL